MTPERPAAADGPPLPKQPPPVLTTRLRIAGIIADITRIDMARPTWQTEMRAMIMRHTRLMGAGAGWSTEATDSSRPGEVRLARSGEPAGTGRVMLLPLHGWPSLS